MTHKTWMNNRVLLNWKPTSSSGLAMASLQAPGICLPLPPRCWNYRHLCTCTRVLGI